MLRPTAIGMLFAATLFWAPSALPQSTVVKPSNQNIVFIHCGPKQPTDPDVQKVAIALLKEGFLVREPEADQDKVAGAGVDYFDEHAVATAQKIADLGEPGTRNRKQEIGSPSPAYHQPSLLFWRLAFHHESVVAPSSRVDGNDWWKYPVAP